MEFVLKGIFDYAVSNGWIGENPVDRVTVPKIASDDDDMVFLSVREVELLADRGGEDREAGGRSAGQMAGLYGMPHRRIACP